METFNAASKASKIQASLQDDLFRTDTSHQEAYIRFQLTKELPALLSMKQVQGSMVVQANQITFMPSMPASVIGITSSRTRVFCVFDLAQLLGFPTELISPRQYQIIMLQTVEKQIYFGLAVIKLQSVMRLATEQISWSVDGFPSQIVPYLSGAVIEAKSTIPILELQSILDNLNCLSPIS